MKPKISIVIPSYNKGHFIQETLESLKAQTFLNWEAIVVDDGSTDDSVNIIQDYCKKDSRLKFLKRNSNPKGGSACRNIGIDHAHGKYIMFLDADDVLAPNCLKNRFKQIENSPENNFWVFSIGTFYKMPGDSTSIWIPKGKDFLSKFLRHDLPWHTMSVIWKKEFLQKIGSFNPDYPRLQDVELHTRALLEDNVQFQTFPEADPDSYYRIDLDRILDTQYHFLKRWVAGTTMYVIEIGKRIEHKSSSGNLKKKLKGTVFSMLTTLLYNTKMNYINTAEYSKLRNQLLNSIEAIELLKRTDFHFLYLYENTYNYGFYRIKGFNYLSKRFFIKHKLYMKK
ncbi:glycosyltransferase [Zunongwangia sp. F260]|uniref:Glycosyltransferase n=1 Tax=Autumnicola lenta TaxID=3075593 RepID=A0ABU3CND2_9FLAO|nr:glycosyltransferase [Zunongwangia sp. F260]MDT0647440.1 glycosyltransferase [Zunongwangia sp. F260]